MAQLKNTQQGFVLITVLIFVTALTFLTMNIIEVSLLESKMSNYYAQERIAFYRAESSLHQAEQNILNNTATQQQVMASPIFKKIASYCGVDYYLGKVSNSYKGATVNLQSTLAKVDYEAQCQHPPTIKSGRKSWLVLY